VSINGTFGVIRAAGDQGGNGGGHPVREAAAPTQPVQQTLTRPQLQPVVQQALAETLAAGVRRLPRASDLGGSGLSGALPIGVLGQGSGAVLGGVQGQPATSPSPAPAAGTPSGSATGSSQAVPLASTPPGPAPGVPDYRARDQVFADLEGIQSVAPALTADPPWTW
jgi:hypothetical protein